MRADDRPASYFMATAGAAIMAISTDVSTAARWRNLVGPTRPGFQRCPRVYVGVAGDVKIDGQDGGWAVTFKAHPVGYMLVQVRPIYSTANGTTATDLVLLY
jgi:hypothetical protein